VPLEVVGGAAKQCQRRRSRESSGVKPITMSNFAASSATFDPGAGLKSVRINSRWSSLDAPAHREQTMGRGVHA